MTDLLEFNFNNTYSKLPGEFFQEIVPTPFENPHLVIISEEAADLIGLYPGLSKSKAFAEYISGKKSIPGSRPLAMYYTGHQFGVYNKDLGDGRAILLGEVINPRGEKWDLHLKGAGRTRYARQFDGRAVLRSCIREFLCSEAMYHLGIPTTRALCIIGSDEIVQRELTETGAMLLRVAQSHVRFGNFEGFYYREDYDNVRVLADYVVKHHYPELEGSDNKYSELLKTIAIKTAELIALWQSYGFTHGVMNTDNMSVLGVTLDYGPYGFVENFNPEFTPNHTDYHGRYSLKNQKSIGYWNLQKLGKCFSELIDNNDFQDAMSNYMNSYRHKYHEIMRKKLGLEREIDDDWNLIEIILECMYKSEVDYTNFFRLLSGFDEHNLKNNRFISSMFKGSDFARWAQYYAYRLKKEKMPTGERMRLMSSVNPKYILRNYLAQIAIEKAESKDYSELKKVFDILKNPFDDQPDFEEYSKPAPPEYENIYISCSS